MVVLGYQNYYTPLFAVSGKNLPKELLNRKDLVRGFSFSV